MDLAERLVIAYSLDQHFFVDLERIGGIAAGIERLSRTENERAIGVVVIALLVGLWDGAGKNVVLVTTAILIATMSAEYWLFRDRIRGTAPEPEAVSS